MNNRAPLGAIAATALAFSLAACGTPPAGSPDAGSQGGSSFLPCIVSNAGGFDDHSFNQLGLEGVKQAAAAHGVEPVAVQAQSASDYGPTMQSLMDRGCSVIVTMGYPMADATEKAAEANPEMKFILVDSTTSKPQPNVKPVLWDTSQAGMLVGYAAASYSKSGKVGTFGGASVPPVTLYMDGFADGVAQFNKDNGKNVEVLGWSVAGQKGLFTGNFTDLNAAKTLAQSLLNQGADVLLPVGGPIYKGAGQAIRDGGDKAALLGVDTDLYATDPSYGDIVLTSIARDMPKTIASVVGDVAADKAFSNATYVGTLENNGVFIAPFHTFESKVDPALHDQIEALQKKIVAKDVSIQSPSKP
ncbi:BMP family protein [Streptomyces sp. NPDC059477]|uniref:BMP family lipoprotein n=1 Tax=Streptomyces sp. NPDC059477 TaxID=3346847 RepID=UPI0036754256